MEREFILSPFVSIRVSSFGYVIKNELNSEEYAINQLSEIRLCDETINKRIFILKDKIKDEKERGYRILENTFFKSITSIGYIETTSRCPYHCRMCPKGENQLVREREELDLNLYSKIISQLKNQKTITLHLFGDPLFDALIYKRVSIANLNEIVPSFSTNLLSISKLDYAELKKLKLGNITISLDSIEPDNFSHIRGKITQNEMERLLHKLRVLCEINATYHIAEKIILQFISLKINRNEKDKIIDLFEKIPNVEIYEKPFISFPLTNANSMKREVIFTNMNKYWIYNILGDILPFKCLKVWNKSEYGINSDGFITPCCMVFNNVLNIQNLIDISLEEIFKSKELKVFRKSIYEGTPDNVICKNCSVHSDRLSHEKINYEELEHLKQYCLNCWSNL